MKHARPDYAGRFVDSEGRIPEEEPVFFLRGQDKHAAMAVRIYADLVEQDGGDPEIVRLSREHADVMEAWPVKKSPDMPAD